MRKRKMRKAVNGAPGRGWVLLLTAVAAWCWSASAEAARFRLDVVDENGSPVSGFKWLLQEDVTYSSTPGVRDPNSLALGFHKSNIPLARAGTGQGLTGSATGSSVVINNVPGTAASPRRYFVSVLPHAGHAMSGAPVVIDETGLQSESVQVVVHSHPIPTAQISIFLFEDNYSLNGAPDLPVERGLGGPAHPFSVILEEPGGQYGMAGGPVRQDAFGNPLGTGYNADGTAMTDADGRFLREDGTVADGSLYPNAGGVLVVKNLAPGKYGIVVSPPAGQGWIQTSTIEGTPVIDAWVKANEPSFFQELGPPGHHVFVGFVKAFDCFANPTDPNCLDPNGLPLVTPGAPGTTLAGQVVNDHLSRPPDYTFYNGDPMSACRIGINQGAAGGQAIYSGACDANSGFAINNMPPGSYQLVVFDDNLDIVIATLGVTVKADGTCNTFDGDCDLGEVPVFNWFAKLETSVFFDTDQDGFHDANEGNLGADQAAVNLRWRDGRIYQSMPIDGEGAAPFEEVFPFFHWLVGEVSFTNLKATGATFTVDAGGPVALGQALNPQPQTCTAEDVAAGTDGCAGVGAPRINPNTGDNLSRTEQGPVLTQAFQGFLGQTSVMEFGKAAYTGTENGGITGIVFYATTRAEEDPRNAVGEPWEPGIPRVQVNLYQDADMNGQIDDVSGSGTIELADVDNYPFHRTGRRFPQAEDLDRNGNSVFDLGDALRTTVTDSWDDAVPTGCQGDTFVFDGQPKDCFDGLRNFNQLRGGVFDGGYAFGLDGDPLAPGVYIVETVPPPGFKLVKEEDKNVDFGDEYTPSLLLLPAVCAGDLRDVPPYLSFATANSDGHLPLLPGADPAASAAPFAGDQVPGSGDERPLCDRRQVRLAARQNAAADFFLFTDVPIAAHVVGGILNDLSNEFDPNSPNFGEKYAPPWLPVSFRDWTGREITRVYADEWGKFNAVLPSTYSVNLPMPSGVSPNMLTACMNDAGPVANPAYHPVDNPNVPQTVLDPHFNPHYSQFCYTFQYMPGATTYLDTPVLPVAAFAGPGEHLDCALPDATPWVAEVTAEGSVLNPGGGPYAAVGDTIAIRSAGLMQVPDPASPLAGATVQRDYRFGDLAGSVTIGGTPLVISQWTTDLIRATIPDGTATGQLLVTSSAGATSPIGVTVTVGDISPRGVHHVSPSLAAGAHPLQDAIDNAQPGDLILVAPGSYDELVIMWQPVQLQGWGALGTTINARKVPAEKTQAWRDKITFLQAANLISIVPGQEVGAVNQADNEPLMFPTEDAGILVVGKDTGNFGPDPRARIDGLTVTGSDSGGGITVNGYAKDLEISNTRLTGNYGVYGGGLRVGHPTLTTEVNGVLIHSDSDNDNLTAHHNLITMNGGMNGAGGGISLYTGTTGYRVTENFVCGNFSNGDGGGIGHLGLSDGGVIARNTIAFNQNFNQGTTVNGGGLFIGGKPGLAGPGSLSDGAGSFLVEANRIQGNNAGAGDGGGIALAFVNGTDVAAAPTRPASWYRGQLYDNIIVNNVAGYAAGGLSIQDALYVDILNNTIANNDSTATVGAAFSPNDPNLTIPQPAGVVSRQHITLTGVPDPGLPTRWTLDFSRPALMNNIIFHNRSFSWQTVQDNDPNTPPFQLVPQIQPDGSGAQYWDLGILGTTGRLNPRNCFLTDKTGNSSPSLGNLDEVRDGLNPMFLAEYVNIGRRLTIQMPETTVNILTSAAADEGGNFIDVRYGPLTLAGDYHIGPASPAINAADTARVNSIAALADDFDGQPRPDGVSGLADIGADEVQP
ncbi:MAG: hypothetical protein AB1634_05365 [Thermodesulfobacteriota bacterium]